VDAGWARSPQPNNCCEQKIGEERAIYGTATGQPGDGADPCRGAFPCDDAKELPMAFRPNYRFDRIERDRLKKAKKEEKLRRQQERKSEEPASDTAAAGEPAPPEA
jgi:hypothetical protein